MKSECNNMHGERIKKKYKCLHKDELQLLSCFKNEKEDCVKGITFLSNIYLNESSQKSSNLQLT